jgi:hypothetical protein
MFMMVQARSRRPGDQDPMGGNKNVPFQLTMRLFAGMARRIEALPPPTG